MNVYYYHIVYFSGKSFYLHILGHLKHAHVMCNFVLRGIGLSTVSHDAVWIFASPESIAGSAPNCTTGEVLYVMLIKLSDITLNKHNYTFEIFFWKHNLLFLWIYTVWQRRLLSISTTIVYSWGHSNSILHTWHGTSLRQSNQCHKDGRVVVQTRRNTYAEYHELVLGSVFCLCCLATVQELHKLPNPCIAQIFHIRIPPSSHNLSTETFQLAHRFSQITVIRRKY